MRGRKNKDIHLKDKKEKKNFILYTIHYIHFLAQFQNFTWHAEVEVCEFCYNMVIIAQHGSSMEGCQKFN